MPGKSTKERKKAQGLIDDYQQYLDDLTEMFRLVEKRFPNLPIYLYGHSMGGNIVLNYMLSQEKHLFKAAIVSAPWLDLAHPLPTIATKFVNRLALKFPNQRVNARLNPHHITRLAPFVEILKYDEIFHMEISFRLYTQVQERGLYAMENVSRIDTPTYLIGTSKDKIVNIEAIRNLAKHAGKNVYFKEYPKHFHALHLDLDGEEVLEDVVKYIEEDLGKDASN